MSTHRDRSPRKRDLVADAAIRAALDAAHDGAEREPVDAVELAEGMSTALALFASMLLEGQDDAAIDAACKEFAGKLGDAVRGMLRNPDHMQMTLRRYGIVLARMH